jgi:hypothetical protein
LALTLTACLLFLVANAFPLVTFELAGRSQSGELISGVLGLYAEGYWELAGLVLFTSILAPLLYLLGLLYVLLPLSLGRRPWGLAPLFRAIETVTPWAMLEVYMFGILVALIKLGDFGGEEKECGQRKSQDDLEVASRLAIEDIAAACAREGAAARRRNRLVQQIAAPAGD